MSTTIHERIMHKGHFELSAIVVILFPSTSSPTAGIDEASDWQRVCLYMQYSRGEVHGRFINQCVLKYVLLLIAILQWHIFHSRETVTPRVRIHA